jgi:hypothetical protein
VRTSLVLSGLPTGQTLANFDFAFQPALERSRIETLATCQWIKENRTLLIQGPPGVGKTHLAVALGVRAVELGFGVAFSASRTSSPRSSAMPTSRLRSKKYLSSSSSTNREAARLAARRVDLSRAQAAAAVAELDGQGVGEGVGSDNVGVAVAVEVGDAQSEGKGGGGRVQGKAEGIAGLSADRRWRVL